MSDGISPQEAARELLIRREARRSLLSYTSIIAPDITPARHHRLLLDKLEAVERGDILRLMIFMPPGSAKSTYASILFPPWYLGRNPEKSVIGASHAGELAERFGRRVRNVVGSEPFKRVFGFGLSGDNAAAGRWETERGGEYYAVGVDASVTGRRADLGIIDDPVKGRAEADSDTIRNRTWDWYKADFWPRLKPGGRIVLIMCMTGETPVLMANGTEKPLRSVRCGDAVASYENGRLIAAKVLNWKSQGLDYTYEIKTISGTTVRANERHPFLAATDGGMRWTRLRDLRPGNVILCAGALGRGSVAKSLDAKSQPDQRAFAAHTITKTDGPRGLGRHLSTRSLCERTVSNIVTALSSLITSVCLMRKADDVQFAESCRGAMSALIGAESSASIIATRRAGSEGFSATTAISWWDTERPSERFSLPLDTFEITRDEIVSITPCGLAEVFDIQVEHTENFIANGLVSHNTRWHEADLAGMLLEEQAAGGEQWEVLSLPAEARENDPLGRQPGELLWPEWFTPQMFATAKADTRNWSALYQQEPVPDTGDYFRAEWMRWYEEPPSRTTLRTYGASDYAVTADGGDYTVHGVIGVDPNDDIYLLDWWRGQRSSDEWVEAFLDLMQRWKPLVWAEESGQILRSLGPFIEKRQRERRVYGYRKPFTSSSDKPTRAQSIRGRMAMGKVYFPKRAQWGADLVSELLRFPAGKNDDQVDVMSLFGRMLDGIVRGTEPKLVEPMRALHQMTFDEVWQTMRAESTGMPKRI